MGKVRCVKDFKCEICGIPGMLQMLTNNYARVRHYVRLVNGKPVFEYHRNSMEYVNRILNGQTNKFDHNNHDQKLNVNGLFNENTGGRSLAWTRTSACHADDPGSNPGGRTF